MAFHPIIISVLLANIKNGPESLVKQDFPGGSVKYFSQNGLQALA